MPRAGSCAKKLLDVKQPQAKVDHLVYFFLATDFEEQTAPNLDAGEKITVKCLDFMEVKALMRDPKARHIASEIMSRVSSLQELLELPAYGSGPLPEAPPL